MAYINVKVVLNILSIFYMRSSGFAKIPLRLTYQHIKMYQHKYVFSSASRDASNV